MNWKLISVGVGGLAIGALTGWAFTADRADLKRKALEADVEDMAIALTEKSRRIRNLEAELEEANRPTVEEMAEETDGHVGSEEKDELTPEEEQEVAVARTNLQALIEPYVSGEDPQDEFVARTARKIVTARGTPPEVISKNTYAWDPDGPGDEYEKITLTYYPRHRILVDEDTDAIDAQSVEAMVGWRSLNQFGGESGDPNIVFVRNHHLQTDFEVVKEEDEDPPIHVQLGMDREEYRTQDAAGLITFREGNV